MIWSTFQRMPSQASSRLTSAPAIAAETMPMSTATVGLAPWPSTSIAALAATEATQAPTRNLPSMAMLAMPLRSEMIPAKAPERDRGRQGQRPREHARQVRGLADEQRRERRDDPERQHDQEHPPPREGAPRTSWRIPVRPVTTPVSEPEQPRPSSRGTRSSRPAGRPRTRTRRACRGRAGAWRASRPSAAMTTPRTRAERRAFRSAPLAWAVTGSRVGVAAVMPGRLPRRAVGARHARAIEAVERADEPGCRHEHDHERLDEEQQVERDAGLHLHQPAAGAQGPEQQRGGHDPGRAVAGEEREGDGVEAVARADVVRHLGNGAQDLHGSPQAGEGA